MIKITDLLTYPLKSGAPSKHSICHVDRYGLYLDRQWAIFDQSGQCITARTHPKLLRLQVSEQNGSYTLYHERKAALTLLPNTGVTHDLSIHSYQAHGIAESEEVSEWLSNYLDTPVTLMRHNSAKHRPVLSKHGGQEETDTVAFADQAPVLIISEATLADLNSRLDKPVPMDRFRPNIVVSGCEAYEEDNWNEIQIGNCRMKVIQQCERCVFTTIDTDTLSKHPSAEPLRTLATYRVGPRGGVVLGVHAVATVEGDIEVGNTLEVLS
ncbi:MAG: MOSC N-terminal beta barrel domain-containing protein [Bacteroidota bacterium]